MPIIVAELREEIDQKDAKNYLTDFSGLLKELMERYPCFETMFYAINELVVVCIIIYIFEYLTTPNLPLL